MFFEFFKLNYFVVVYGVVLLLSIYNYRKYFDTALKYLPIIIAYTLLNELLGYFIEYYSDFSFFTDLKNLGANEIIYNLYDIIFYFFFYAIYWKLIRNKKIKSLVVIAAISTLIGYIISCFFEDPITTYLYQAAIVGSLALVVTILLYFTDKYLHTKSIFQKYNLVFWISLGLIIFYTFFPIFLFVSYAYFDIWEKYYFKTILRALIIMMYALFATGFVIGRKRAFK